MSSAFKARLAAGLTTAAVVVGSSRSALALNCKDLPAPIYGVGGSAPKPLFAKLAKALTACSSESNPRPPDTTFTTSSSSTTGAAGTGGAGTGSTGSSSATGTGGAGGAPQCDGPNGCYACPPKTGSQLLNACTGAQCSPFDNVKRLPLYNNGTLPPIP